MSVKCFARNSGAGNGGEFCFFLEGGSADIIFMGARIFLNSLSDEAMQALVFYMFGYFSDARYSVPK